MTTDSSIADKFESFAQLRIHSSKEAKYISVGGTTVSAAATLNVINTCLLVTDLDTGIKESRQNKDSVERK
ncbi:hypothetical protein BDZ94DRAFT_1250884 [Collybia nuda]|uniref:Uncharacterized protein n=1 Tax=Collybia nuda TaxID=64659 RepID=A0A9P5YDH0_9AGAR|nr:hypothetical protein BDZ94DRAFT_1250884 [Collybia nuda]